MIDRDPAHLHPAFRSACSALILHMSSAGLPFAMFEGWRSPERQAALYAQGRTTPGPVVTNARPWQSYHQHGLGADFVGLVNGAWTWDAALPWDKLAWCGKLHGLEALTWEKPHLQLAGLDLANLMVHAYPAGGDASWHDNLLAAVNRWDGTDLPVLLSRVPTAPKPGDDSAEDLNAAEARRLGI